MRNIVLIPLYFSPTVALVVQTIIATRESSYQNNRLTIRDPGHRRIRIYDFLVLFTSYVIALYIFYLNIDFTSVETWPISNEIKLSAFLLFPQITGGWITFVLWNAYFVFLRFYDVKRSMIVLTTLQCVRSQSG